ncbi:MAG: glycosyltransferase family 2 protein [Acidobacteriaceae bacterium]|nr:glycosyltransferase family 2 protein [Acidobacteriaceae bacterium]
MSAASVIFFLSIVFILYVLIGYPALLAGYAKIRPKFIDKQIGAAVPVSIIIPVRNGAAWIRPKLESLLASEYPPDLINILVVSDGSSDGTNEIVTDFGDRRVRLLMLPPGGKATAVSAALQHVGSDIIVLTDVRQQFDPLALARLIACFNDPTVGVVTGELMIREGGSSEEYNTGLYWRYEKWIRRNLNRVDAMLGATGAIYAIRRKLTAPLPPEILLDDVYLPFVAAFRGFRIYFEDSAKAYDLPTSLQSEFRRKVRTQAGIYQILAKFPKLLWPGNRRFIHFLSHKVGRLLLPFAMMSAFCSSFFISHPWREGALAGQALFYGAGLVDPLISESSFVKRVTSVIRAFLVLTAAAFFAVAIFFLPAQRLWKETRVGLANKSTV